RAKRGDPGPPPQLYDPVDRHVASLLAMTTAWRGSAWRCSSAQGCEIVSDQHCVGMRGAERLFADRQLPLDERPRPRKVALGVKQEGKIDEARGGIMVGAERLLADRQRALVKRQRARKVALVLKQ